MVTSVVNGKQLSRGNVNFSVMILMTILILRILLLQWWLCKGWWIPMIWIIKEAKTTAQPQPPSGGVADCEEDAPGASLAPFSLISPMEGDFSLGGEALTGISCSESLAMVTGSSLSGPAISQPRGNHWSRVATHVYFRFLFHYSLMFIKTTSTPERS